MINHYDIAYALGVGVSTPYWMVKSKARRKVLKAFSERMGPTHARLSEGPGVMIHAVSLGEMDATRSLVDRLRSARPGLHFIISTTTETGFDRGRKLYDGLADVTLVRYPLDFSHAVDRLLDNLKPSVVVLMELEVWPNFLRKCRRRRVPVLVVNGRVTTHSFGRYQLVKPLIAGTFGRLTHVLCAGRDVRRAVRGAGRPGRPGERDGDDEVRHRQRGRRRARRGRTRGGRRPVAGAGPGVGVRLDRSGRGRDHPGPVPVARAEIRPAAAGRGPPAPRAVRRGGGLGPRLRVPVRPAVPRRRTRPPARCRRWCWATPSAS